jgi:hypothetical protein
MGELDAAGKKKREGNVSIPSVGFRSSLALSNPIYADSNVALVATVHRDFKLIKLWLVLIAAESPEV